MDSFKNKEKWIKKGIRNYKNIEKKKGREINKN